MLGDLDQPGEDRVGIDRKHAGDRANAKVFRQRPDGPYQLVRGDTFPMQWCAMRLKKIPVTGAARELAPGTATRMTVGRDMAQPAPAPIATIGIGTEMMRGVDVTAATSGRSRRRGW